MAWFAQTARSWTESGPLETAKGLLEAALFRNPEPQPVSAWRMIIDPPMPYWVTLFSQSCRIISLLILLPIFLIGVLDFAGYAVFRTLGLHRRRVRIQRQTKEGIKVPVGRTNSTRRKPRVYQNDRHRPTDRSNIPSIVKAPLLSPGTYDAETLLRQRARSLSSASAEEEAAWVASGGQQARLSTITKDEEILLTSPDFDAGSQSDADAPRDYFGRAPRVGVDGALGLADTDVDESGTESGRDSPVQRFSQLKGHSRRRGLSGGLNFTPVSPDKPAPPLNNTVPETAPTQDTDSYSASVASLSDSPTSSSNGDRFLAPATSSSTNSNKPKSAGSITDDAASSNMSSSWIGVEADQDSIAPSVAVDSAEAAAAAGLEPSSKVWSDSKE
ncbi:uncharacterized protein UTRI_04600_B [Ustilago trichophora]|uniref:Uncharacterized protein n=1 Tax=Ustilago trichophora TaxID=86804 RepID=A0A5C3EBY7_9BASI|nr:uncharacterized protein UTRI_04600_B [Ustilago trichophora]